MRAATWACGLACLLLASPARAGGPSSTNALGMEGLWRLDAARGRGAGTATLQLSTSGAHTAGLSVPTDSDTYTSSRLSAVWDPIDNLQVGFGMSYATNTYSDVFRLSDYRLGNPTLRAKFGHLVGRQLWLGGLVGLTLPTAVERATLQAQARAASGSLLASWEPTARLHLTANLTYVSDRSRLLSTVRPTPDRRLILSQYAGDHASWGVGGQLHFTPLASLGLAAFAELGEELALQQGLVAAPPRLALGARLTSGRRLPLEVAIGADVRLAGAGGRANALMPPALPWQAFAQLGVHFDGGPPAAAAGDSASAGPARPLLMSSANACTWDLDCRPGQTCVEGGCQRLIRQPVEVKAKPLATYVVAGLVVDAEDHQPLRDAYVEIKGHQGTRLRADPRAGTFRTWAVPIDEVLDMTAFAEGFQLRRVVVAPFEGRPLVRVTFVLHADPNSRPMTVRGLLRDRIWGSAVRGTVVATSVGRQARSSATGLFEMHLPAGRHEVIITAPGYLTQRKQFAGEAGETIVINADLEPFGRRQQMP